MRALELVSLELAVAWLVRALPPGLREDGKAVGVRRLKPADRLFETLSHPAREVDHHTQIAPVHGGQHLVRSGGVAHLLAQRDAVLAGGREAEVRVDVDDRKAGARNVGHGDVEHALRLEILERERRFRRRACFRRLRDSAGARACELRAGESRGGTASRGSRRQDRCSSACQPLPSTQHRYASWSFESKARTLCYSRSKIRSLVFGSVA